MRFRKVGAIAALLLAVQGLPAVAAESVPGAVEASPEFYRSLLENDQVAVIEMLLPPGASDQLHHHTAETVCFERGGTLRIHLPDGSSSVHEVPNGAVMWHDAWTHRVENIGEKAVKAIIVEDRRH